MPKTSILEKLVFAILVAPLAIPLLQTVAMIAGHSWDAVGLWTITASPFGRTLVFQGMVWCAATAYALLALRDTRYRPFLTRTHGWFLALFAALMLTALVGHDTRFSFWSDAERAEGLVFLAHVGTYLFLLSWVIHAAARFQWFLRVAVGLALGTLALLTLDAFQQHRSVLSVDTWRYQANALLGNPNFFTHWILLVLTAHTAILLQRTTSERWRTVVSWCIAAVFLGYLVLVASSTALGLAALLLAYVGWRMHRATMYGVVIACILGALAVTLFWSPNILTTATEALWDSFTIRWQIWTSGTATALAHEPLLGYGLGNADLVWNDAPRDAFAWYSPYSQYRYDRMHNFLLEYFIAGGAIVLAIGVALWGRLCVRLVQRARRSRTAEHAALSLAIILAYLLWNFDSLMGYILTSILIVGVMLMLDEPRRVIRLPTTGYGLPATAGAGTALLTVVALLMLVIQPLRASAARMRADHLLTVTEARRTAQHVPAILTALVDALRVRHPYDLLAKDVLDTGMRLAATPVLTDEQRAALHDALLATADRLAADHPENPHLTHRRAWIHARFDERDAEIAALKATGALAPTNGPFRFQLVHAYLRAGRYDEARAIVEAFLREGTFTDPATFLLGLLDILQDDLAGGRRTTSRALTAYAPTPAEWQQLTEAQRVAGATDAAIAAWYQRLKGFAATPDGVVDALERMGANERSHER